MKLQEKHKEFAVKCFARFMTRTIGVNLRENNPRNPQTGRCGLQPHRIPGRNREYPKTLLSLVETETCL